MNSWISKFALMATLGGAAVGCGGSPKKAAAPTESPCAAMAAHIIAVSPEDAFGKDAAATKATVQQVMSDRCQADAWSPDAVHCMTAATTDSMKACGEKLTPAQQQAVASDMAAKLGGNMKGDDEKAGAPAPDGAKAMDPCAGGE